RVLFRSAYSALTPVRPGSGHDGRAAQARAARRRGEGVSGAARDGAGLESGRRRRAWIVGILLFLGVVAAALVVAWNDLRVRQEADRKSVQALADSHARQVAHALDPLARPFRGLADGLQALPELSPDAAARLMAA